MVDKPGKLWYSLLVKLDALERSMVIMLEKYETPEVEFVEMEEEDVIVASGLCAESGRGAITYNC